MKVQVQIYIYTNTFIIRLPSHLLRSGSDSDGSSLDFALPKVASKASVFAKGKPKVNSGGESTFTVDSVLDSFKGTTEYGASFRSMTSETQAMEVVRLNKGAASGMKGGNTKAED